MYSNNLLTFQEPTTILNVCTKKVWKLIECTTIVLTFILTRKLHFSNYNSSYLRRRIISLLIIYSSNGSRVKNWKPLTYALKSRIFSLFPFQGQLQIRIFHSMQLCMQRQDMSPTKIKATGKSKSSSTKQNRKVGYS